MNQPQSSLGTYKAKDKSNQYQNYDDQFYKFKKNNPTSLNQWSLMQSQLMPKKQIIQQQIHVYSNPQSFSAKVDDHFKTVSYDDKSNQQLSSQMKQMRKIMQQYNQLLNSKLNKYELAQNKPKVLMITNKPQIQSQLLLTQIEINNKSLDSQQKQIDVLRRKQKDLQQRDYLIELEERVTKIGKQIHNKRKIRYDQEQAIRKLDNKLLQLRDVEQDRQFKVLKFQIMYYFKKFYQNRQKLQDLENNYDNLINKDNKINQKYRQFVKQATDKFLLVKANPYLLKMKRQSDFYLNKIEHERKKIQLNQKSQRWKQQKVQKDMWLMQKQIHQIQFKLQQHTTKNQQLSSQISQKLQKHNINPQKIRNIAYRFDDQMIKNNTNKINLGPFVKLDKNNNNKDPKSSRILNKSTQVPNKFKTLQQNDSPPQTYKINDKNHQSISPSKNQFRINLKPKMKIKKKQSKNNQTIDTGQLDKQLLKSGSNQISSHKPEKLKKILIGKNDKRFNVPLTDQYLRSLEEKGKKNLNI